MNNKSTVSIVVAAIAATTLSGCIDESEEDVVLKQQIEIEALKDANEKLATQQSELDRQLKELQAKDPTVKDVYPSVDSEGKPTVVVVKDSGDGTSSSDVWPLVGGMAAGMLLGNMLSSGGVSAYQRQYPPVSSFSNVSREDERKRRAFGYSAYIANQRQALYSTNYSTYQSKALNSPTYKSVISSRTSGAFAGSSARAVSVGS